jgi:hypothetical protein
MPKKPNKMRDKTDYIQYFLNIAVWKDEYAWMKIFTITQRIKTLRAIHMDGLKSSGPMLMPRYLYLFQDRRWGQITW